MPVQFVEKQEDLKIPKGGLILEEQKPTDYVMGATSKLPQIVIRPDGQHDDFLPVVEIQRVGENFDRGDTFMCVSFSRNNVLEILHKEQYGYEINMDDLFLGVGSGTKPYQGNGVATVAEWGRKHIFINEKNRLKNMRSVEEAYTPVTQAELDEAEKNMQLYETGYDWLPRNGLTQYVSPDELAEALKYGPIQASVDGSAYRFNAQGFIGEFREYTHEIVIFGYERNKYFKIFDSETEQALKFSWNYPFGYPMRHTLKKKTMKIYRKNGQAAIGFLNLEDGGIYLWSDGKIAGGSLFKTLGFSYSLAEVVDEWPAPIKGYITTTGLQSGIEE